MNINTTTIASSTTSTDSAANDIRNMFALKITAAVVPVTNANV